MREDTNGEKSLRDRIVQPAGDLLPLTKCGQLGLALSGGEVMQRGARLRRQSFESDDRDVAGGPGRADRGVEQDGYPIGSDHRDARDAVQTLDVNGVHV